MPTEANPFKPGTTSMDIITHAVGGVMPAAYQRVSAASKRGTEFFLREMDSIGDLWNLITPALVNRIGTVIGRNRAWSNPLAEFKMGMMSHASKIEDYQMSLLRAKGYDPREEYGERDIFGTALPHVESNFHTVTRRDMYKVTVDGAELRRAFIDGQEMDSFVSRAMELPTTSDNFDEFILTTGLFREFENNGGFYHVHVPDLGSRDSSAEDARYMLRRVREMGANVTYPSAKYNSARMDSSFAKMEDLVLFATPEAASAIDVEALAAAFNIDRARLPTRVITVPAEYMPSERHQAILVDKNFFIIADTVLKMNSIQNPAEPNSWNHFLHHHSIISASRFVPAITFWTGADDEVVHMVDPVESIKNIAITDAADEEVSQLTRGQHYRLSAETDSADHPAVAWSAVGTDTRTSATTGGVLLVGGREDGPVKITATADGVSESRTVAIGDISGQKLPTWPRTESRLEGIYVISSRVRNFDPENKAYSVTRSRKDLLTRDTDARVYPIGSNLDYTVSVTANGATYEVKLAIKGRDGIDYGEYTVTVS